MPLFHFPDRASINPEYKTNSKKFHAYPVAIKFNLMYSNPQLTVSIIY